MCLQEDEHLVGTCGGIVDGLQCEAMPTCDATQRLEIDDDGRGTCNGTRFVVVLSVVLVLTLAGGGTVVLRQQWHAHQKRNRPFDFEAMLAQLQEEGILEHTPEHDGDGDGIAGHGGDGAPGYGGDAAVESVSATRVSGGDELTMPLLASNESGEAPPRPSPGLRVQPPSAPKAAALRLLGLLKQAAGRRARGVPDMPRLLSTAPDSPQLCETGFWGDDDGIDSEGGAAVTSIAPETASVAGVAGDDSTTLAMPLLTQIDSADLPPHEQTSQRGQQSSGLLGRAARSLLRLKRAVGMGVPFPASAFDQTWTDAAGSPGVSGNETEAVSRSASEAEPGPRVVSHLKFVAPREIANNAVRVLGRIGGGNFGDVFAAMLDERASTGTPAYSVAVKMPKPNAEGTGNRDDLLREAVLMAQFDHANIVALIGVVSRGQQCRVVLQYCEQGSLDSLLRHDKLNGGEAFMPDKVALGIAADIAAGMAYLESKRFVHRDLAARNILVAADDACMVADFGMSRALRHGSEYSRLLHIRNRFLKKVVLQDL